MRLGVSGAFNGPNPTGPISAASQGITRENISSHLQKYRAYLRRIQARKVLRAFSSTLASRACARMYPKALPPPPLCDFAHSFLSLPLPVARPQAQQAQQHQAFNPAQYLSRAPATLSGGAPIRPFGETPCCVQNPASEIKGCLPPLPLRSAPCDANCAFGISRLKRPCP